MSQSCPPAPVFTTWAFLRLIVIERRRPTGKSAGLAPWKILSTKAPARRNTSSAASISFANLIRLVQESESAELLVDE